MPLSSKSSVDPSIREGFSWLIKEIEADYNKLNARIKPSKSAPHHPKEKGKPAATNSESDDGYPKRRSSLTGRRDKVPPLDLSRVKNTPRNGHETYDEDDDDDQVVSKPTRPKISDSKGSDFHSRRTESPPLPSYADSHKKKTTTGNASSIRGSTNDTNTKPFRTSFETLPEEAPWSMSTTRSTKNDSNLLKPSWSNDSAQRDRSPMSREPKVMPLTSSSSKRDNLSDDDEAVSYGQGLKNKVTYLSLFDSIVFISISSTASLP